MPKSLFQRFIVVFATVSILSMSQPLSAQNRVDNHAVLGEFLLLLLGSERASARHWHLWTRTGSRVFHPCCLKCSPLMRTRPLHLRW